MSKASYLPVATVEDGVELQEDPLHGEENPTSDDDEVEEAEPTKDDDEVEEADYDYPTPSMRGDTMSSTVPLLPVPFGRHVGRMSVCWEKRMRDGTRKFFCVIGDRHPSLGWFPPLSA